MTGIPDSSKPRRKLLLVDTWKWEAMGSIASVLGFVGVLFAVYQYFQQIEAERAREALEMIEIWETRGYRDAFNILKDDVITFLDKVPEADKAKADENPMAANNLQASMYRDIFSKEGNDQRFEDVIYYFNRLGLCVEANLCSVRTASVFFDDTLIHFLSGFDTKIEKQRMTLPNYAEGVLSLADAFRRSSN